MEQITSLFSYANHYIDILSGDPFRVRIFYLICYILIGVGLFIICFGLFHWKVSLNLDKKIVLWLKKCCGRAPKAEEEPDIEKGTHAEATERKGKCCEPFHECSTNIKGLLKQVEHLEKLDNIIDKTLDHKLKRYLW
ncbi:hypothetical protein XELAEV_18038782mg [Xenopus laevis]|uniref:Uncharacterized protein n=1 Tax=Xenopus laevis TaxID=8355 RepID=A0A974C687_XENLA|nr:hypothetical protein XELAEV_18038782mg [Xenopus laevis]